MSASNSVPRMQSSLSVRRDTGTDTAEVDLASLWHAPFPRYDAPTAPLAQELRSPSVQLDESTSAASEPIVRRRRAHQGAHADRYLIVGHWRGWVTAVLQDTFIGEIEDLRWRSPPHEVELPVALVSDFDRDLLAEDSIFYWTVGYRYRSGGTRVQEARVRFRRSPRSEPWAERRGVEWAARMRQGLDESDEY